MRRCLIGLSCLLLLTGCSTQKSGYEGTISTEEEATASSMLTEEEQLLAKEQERVVFSEKTKLPIIIDGSLYGFFKIKKIQKINAPVLSDKEAEDAGINYVYSFLLEIDASEYFKCNDTELTIKTSATIMKGDKALSKSAKIGWSGYTESVTLFPESPQGYIALEIQPYCEDVDQVEFVFITSGSETQPVCVSFIPDKVEVLNSLALQGDTVVIESINGAQLAITVNNVFLEEHDVRGDSTVEDDSYWFYDVDYKIEYLRGPTNDTSVVAYDALDNYSLTKYPVMRVYADTDDTVLDQGSMYAERLLWSDSYDTDYYCTEKKTLPVGSSIHILENRFCPVSTVVKPKYVRVYFEFPTEKRASTPDTFTNFKGRYLLWQIPITDRVLEVEPDE